MRARVVHLHSQWPTCCAPIWAVYIPSVPEQDVWSSVTLIQSVETVGVLRILKRGLPFFNNMCVNIFSVHSPTSGCMFTSVLLISSSVTASSH